jgi:hypothetical protein
LASTDRQKHKGEVLSRFAAFTLSARQKLTMNTTRVYFQRLAEHIVDNTKVSREQSLALTALEEAKYWTNQNIARNGLDPLPPTAAAIVATVVAA